MTRPLHRCAFTTRALDSLSKWAQGNNKSIYGCTYAPEKYAVPAGTKLTYNPTSQKLYVHLFDYPKDGKLLLPGYGGKIKYAQLLHDNSELLTPDKKRIVQFADSQDIVLVLPEKKPDYTIPVIELILK